MEALVYASAILMALLPVAWRADDGQFDLLSFFLIRWWSLVALYAISPVPYTGIRSFTWLILFISVVSFTVGYLIVKSGPGGRQVHVARAGMSTSGRVPSRSSGEADGAYWRTVHALFAVGAVVFAYYAINVVSQYGWTELALSPHRLRIDISQGDVPSGFHYFYVMELIAPLFVIGFLRFRERAPGRMLATTEVSLALSSLLATTARTNVTKSLVWTLLLAFWATSGQSRRRVANVGAIGAVGVVGLFTLYGNFIGKSFANSAVARLLGDGASPASRALALPLHYNAGPLPGLDQFLHDPTIEHTWGALTFRPIAQVVGALSESYSAPSHIGEFYDIGVPFNVATWLDIMYKDFNVAGIAVLPFLLGVAAGAFAFYRRQRPESLAVLFAHSWFAMVIFAAPTNAAFIKASYWLQLAILLLLARHVVSVRRISQGSLKG